MLFNFTYELLYTMLQVTRSLSSQQTSGLLEQFDVIILVLKLQNDLSEIVRPRSILKLYVQLYLNAFPVKTL